MPDQNNPFDNQNPAPDTPGVVPNPPADTPTINKPLPFPEDTNIPPISPDMVKDSPTFTPSQTISDSAPLSNPDGSTSIPPMVPSLTPKKKFGGKKMIATILGILVLLGSLGAGIILVKQQQDIREKAALAEPCKACVGVQCKTIASPPDCSPSLNECSSNSQCAAPTPKPTDTPETCKGKGEVCGKFNTVLYDCCEGRECKWVVGNALDIYTCEGPAASTPTPTPTTGAGTPTPTPPSIPTPKPEAKCSKDSVLTCIGKDPGDECGPNKLCKKKESFGSDGKPICGCISQLTPTPTPTPTSPGVLGRCAGIKAYDSKWNPLASADMATTIKVGDTIYFAVKGEEGPGKYDQAQFMINGKEKPATDKPKEGIGLYQAYVIQNTDVGKSISVKARIHNTVLGWSEY